MLMRTMQAKQPSLGEHSSEVAELARRGRAALRHDAARRSTRSPAPPSCTTSARSASRTRSSTSPARSTATSGSSCASTRSSASGSSTRLPALRPVARLVRSTHERWDGTGYPDRLEGTEIPRGARIVAVCDAYEAMTSDRAYRRRALARGRLPRARGAMAGTQFDPEVVAAFVAEVERPDRRHRHRRSRRRRRCRSSRTACARCSAVQLQPDLGVDRSADGLERQPVRPRHVQRR